MTIPAWQTETYSLAWLERAARLSRGHFDQVVPWLKLIGVMPVEVVSMPLTQVLNSANKDALPAGYLASSAFEWDTWGDSEPEDFMRAIHQEVACEDRDRIASILNLVGAVTGEKSEDTPTYKCHVALP